MPLLHWADNLDIMTVVLASILIISQAVRDLITPKLETTYERPNRHQRIV